MSTTDQTHTEPPRKRPISLTVRTDLIKEARALRLNTSRAAEAGIEAAVKKAKEDAWLSENKAAIDAYNERIARTGTLLKPIWLPE